MAHEKGRGRGNTTRTCPGQISTLCYLSCSSHARKVFRTDKTLQNLAMLPTYLYLEGFFSR